MTMHGCEEHWHVQIFAVINRLLHHCQSHFAWKTPSAAGWGKCDGRQHGFLLAETGFESFHRLLLYGSSYFKLKQFCWFQFFWQRFQSGYRRILKLPSSKSVLPIRLTSLRQAHWMEWAACTSLGLLLRSCQGLPVNPGTTNKAG